MAASPCPPVVFCRRPERYATESIRRAFQSGADVGDAVASTVTGAACAVTPGATPPVGWRRSRNGRARRALEELARPSDRGRDIRLGHDRGRSPSRVRSSPRPRRDRGRAIRRARRDIPCVRPSSGPRVRPARPASRPVRRRSPDRGRAGPHAGRSGAEGRGDRGARRRPVRPAGDAPSRRAGRTRRARGNVARCRPTARRRRRPTARGRRLPTPSWRSDVPRERSLVRAQLRLGDLTAKGADRQRSTAPMRNGPRARARWPGVARRRRAPSPTRPPGSPKSAAFWWSVDWSARMPSRWASSKPAFAVAIACRGSRRARM